MSDKHKDHSHSETEPHSHAGFLGANTELLFALASGFMLAAGFIIGKVSASAYFHAWRSLNNIQADQLITSMPITQ